MHKHEVRMVDLHIQIPLVVYQILKEKYSGYGELSRVLRFIIQDYVKHNMMAKDNAES